MNNRNEQFVVELGDTHYSLRRNTLRTISSAAKVSGDKWVVSDFEGVTPHVMTVDSPAKYVDAVLEKRMRETGALIGGGKVLVLRKRRRGPRSTEAFFIAVPADVYRKYAAAEDDDHNQLLFAFPMLLSRALDRLAAKKPVAILITHGRNVDVLVGDERRTYGTFRTFQKENGTTQTSLIENLHKALRGIEQEHNIKISKLHGHHWLLPDTDSAKWVKDLAISMGIACVQGKLRTLKFDGTKYFSSVPDLLRKLSVMDSASTLTQKYLYQAQGAMTWATIALAGITVLALTATIHWDERTDYYSTESALIEASLVPPDPAPAVLKAAYEKPLALADTLGRAQISPSLQNVLADISAAVSGRVVFDELLLEYPSDELKIAVKLIGHSVETENNKGVPSFNTFIAALRARGYLLVESKLRTDLNALSFSLALERSIQ